MYISDIVSRLPQPEQSLGQSNRQTYGIWLDTLLCPIVPEWAKTRSIERIRNVYENASHVLVLDASVRSYSTEGMHPNEILLRIFTSSWMRRLWTLQGIE